MNHIETELIADCLVMLATFIVLFFVILEPDRPSSTHLISLY